MSPVLSSSARAVGSRRRRATQSAATLFPLDPATSLLQQASPTPRTEGFRDALRHAAQPSDSHGSGGSTAGYTTADCPPPTSSEAASPGSQSPANDRTPGAAVPLVGIARLAASSPS